MVETNTHTHKQTENIHHMTLQNRQHETGSQFNTFSIQRAKGSIAEWEASLCKSEEGRTRDQCFGGVYSADLKAPPFSDYAQCSHGLSEEG